MKKIKIKTNKPVAVPFEGKLLEGAKTVDNSSYWRERLRDGSVSLVSNTYGKLKNKFHTQNALPKANENKPVKGV